MGKRRPKTLHISRAEGIGREYFNKVGVGFVCQLSFRGCVSADHNWAVCGMGDADQFSATNRRNDKLCTGVQGGLTCSSIKNSSNSDEGTDREHFTGL